MDAFVMFLFRKNLYFFKKITFILLIMFVLESALWMHLEDSALCLGGCRVIKTFDHLVVGFDIYLSLWIKILIWLSIFGPLPNVADHVSQFCNIYRVGKKCGLG
jgi:hypothetical protein